VIGFIILLTILFSAAATGQQTAEDYEFEKEKLTANKIKLEYEISELKIHIDSLIFIIPGLEQNLTSALRKLYILKYGEEIGNKIAYKQIWTGMTDEMVLESWGEPDRVDKNVEEWGTFTQWFYGNVTFFFKDGKLTDWEGEEEKTTN
jgi:hypothetical protein